MPAGGDFQGIAAYTAAQYPHPHTRHQTQRKQFPGRPAFTPHGTDFAAAAGGQFIKTDMFRHVCSIADDRGLRVYHE